MAETFYPPEELQLAQQAVTRFVERHAPAYRLLLYHAALPLLLTPELLNYLRTKFLQAEVPWVAEADLLLSELCRQVGYEQYVMEPAVRAYLLQEMKQDPALGQARMEAVARLLIHYVQHLARADAFAQPHELQAQQWAAMVYIGAQRETAVREITTAFKNAVSTTLLETLDVQPVVNQAEITRLAQITQELSLGLEQYPDLLDYASQVAKLLPGSSDKQVSWRDARSYRDFDNFPLSDEYERKGVGRVTTPQFSHIDKRFQVRPRFVGREEEQQVLQRYLQQIVKSRHHGGIVILHGARGIGKSHFWQQVGNWAQINLGYTCLWGRCSQYGATYQLFADILRQYLGLEENDDHLIQRDKLIQEIGDLFGSSEIPRKAPYLAIVMGLPREKEWESKIRRLEEQYPDRVPERIALEVVSFLRRVAEGAPLFVICDDLQWLNDDAAVILDALMRAVGSTPRLMLGLSLCPGKHPRFSELELRASREYRFLTEWIDLEPLGLNNCYQILEDIIPDPEVLEAQRTLICAVSGGNPFLIVANARNQVINPGAEISPTIQKGIENWINDLPEDALRVLNVAAVIGNYFSLEEVDYALIGEINSKTIIRRGLGQLQSAYLIVSKEKSYHFAQEQTREVAYLRQSEASRRHYHQRLGAYWAENEHPAKAADHYYAAGIWDEAARLGAIAGKTCFTSYANAEGIRLCLQALEAAQKQPDIELQIHLHQLLGDLYYRVGQYQNAANYYRRELYGLSSTDASASEQAAVYCALGAVYDQLGRYDEALEVLSRGLSQVGSDPSIIRAKLLRVCCTVLRNKEKLAAAEEVGLQAIEIAAQIPATLEAELELAYVHNNLATVYAAQQRTEEALTHYQRALIIRQRHREVYEYEYAQSLENVGTQLCRLKRFSEALPYYEQALEIQQRIGDPVGEASVLHNWAWLHWDLAELESAEKKFLRALAVWSNTEYRKGMAFARQDLGTLYAEQAQWELALEYLREAEQLYEQLQIHHSVSIEAEIAKIEARLKVRASQPSPATPPTAPAISTGVDFVLVTALHEELDAVLAHLPDYTQLPPSRDDIRTYYQATLPVTFPDGSAGQYRIIVLSPLGIGRVQVVAATSDAIRKWQPRYILLIGIAGGIAARKVQIGDILIADLVFGYEYQKLTPSREPEEKWTVHSADIHLLSACKNIRNSDWQQRIKVERPHIGEPTLHFGPIASGDMDITSAKKTARYQDIWPKLLGLEMEAAGVAAAAFESSEVPGFFMVLGVSDLADEAKGSPDVEKWRAYVFDVAAAFAITLLEIGPIPLLEERSHDKDYKQTIPSSELHHLIDTRYSDSQLEALLLQHFTPVFNVINRNMGKNEKIALLLSYCTRDKESMRQLTRILDVVIQE